VKSVAILRLFFFRDKVKFQIVMEQSNQTEICKESFLLFLKGQKFGSTEIFQMAVFKKKKSFLRVENLPS
jgi:hypothetical protein